MSGERRYARFEDWHAALAAGVDPGLRPVPAQFAKGNTGMVAPPVPQHYPVSLSLFAKSESAKERRRLVNQLLVDAGVRPRRG